MNRISSITFLAAMAASGLATAAPAYTTPVGYVTETIKASQFGLIGLTVQNPKIVAGNLETIGSSSVTDSEANFNSLLTSGQTYILLITSGPAVGSLQEITSWTSNSLTTLDNLATAGVVAGNTYTIRKAATVSEIFGATNQAGLQAGDSSTADIVWVPIGGGAFAKYFYSPAVTFPIASPAGWKTTSGADASNLPIVYADSIFIQRRGTTDLTLTFSGEVETKPVTLVLEGGQFNYVGGIFPAGSTLASSGLSASVLSGDSTTADLVWIPDGNGGYLKYYYSPAVTFPVASPAGWKSTSGAASDSIALKSGVIIQRRGTTASAKISPPSSYADL